MKKAITLMAVATGSESKEVEIKRYIGLGAVGILAVNPTRAESNKIFNSSFSNEEINYVGETVVKNASGEDVKTQQVRITFITKTDPKIGCNSEIDTIIPVTFFLSKGYQYSQKNGVTKVKVIDGYGQTAWVTSEELKAGAIPEYEIKRGPNAGKTMKAQLFPGYRPAYIGEEELMQFIAALLNIPSPKAWNESAGTYELKTDPKELEKCECRFDLDAFKAFFTGNMKELEKVVKFQPNNRLKLLFGVRKDKSGNLRQCAYTAMPLKLGVTSLSSLENALKEDAQVGRHPSETYEICNLKEFKASATNYAETAPKGDDDPFASANTAHEEAAPSLPMDADPFGGSF